MARGERQGDGVRAGVGTISRPARGARPGPSQDERPGQSRDERPPGRSERDAPVPILGRAQRPPQDPSRRPDAAPRTAARPGSRIASAVPAGQRPVPASASPAQAGSPPAGPAPSGLRARIGRAPWRVPPGARTSSPQPAARTTGPMAAVRTTGPQAAVRTTGPLPAAPSAPPRAPAPDQPGPAPVRSAGRRAAASHRMPFMLLLCGLLGGALVCALVISTTLAEGSFQITKLQNATSALTRQKQVLQEQVAQQESPQVIAQEAAKLGLQRPQALLFFDLKTGKTSNDGPTWPGAVNAPGYAP